MSRYCTKCGAINSDTAQYCTNCQAVLAPVSTGYQPMQSVNPNAMIDWQKAGADKKVIAGVLGILVGGFGIHKFVLGYTTEGIITIVITILTCGIGHIIGLVEGIIYLTKSDEEFVQTYIQGKKGWF